MKPSFYLAGKYDQRALLQTYASKLRSRGFYVHAEWLEGGHEDTLDVDQYREFATADFFDIRNSDCFVMVNTAGVSAGRNIEFGYALAHGKPCYIIGTPTSIFHHTVLVFPTFEDFLEYITNS
jgi:nucleoside 2-deoxyribosyltransferase